MKVKELIEVLKKEVDGELNVYLSCDEEGNSFSTMVGQSIEVNIDDNGKPLFVIFYPYEEGLSYEDLK